MARLNGARNIARVLEQISDDLDEIISVAGGSTDATLITALSERTERSAQSGTRSKMHAEPIA
jgi:glycosyltransferase involved in cell wall biosynthesis